MSKKMTRNRRRRAHQDQTKTRNQMRGFTSSDLARVGGSATFTSPEIVSRAINSSTVNVQQPSGHSPRTRRRLEAETIEAVAGEPMSPEEWSAKFKEAVAERRVEQGLPPMPPAMPEPTGSDSFRLPPTDVHPSEEDWDEMRAEAKAKRKAIRKLCERRGWALIGTDPKVRTEWQR